MFIYDYYSLILLLPLTIFSLIIQAKLNTTYSKYSKVNNSKGTTGAEIAKLILSRNGISGVSIQCIPGKMSDHFDPAKNVIRLSEDVYHGTSVASIGIAAHETGHALQYAMQYTPVKIRSSVVGVTNFSSKLLYVVLILSFIVNLPILCDIAVVCFAVLFFFQLITLPVEFNASRRAVEAIEGYSYSGQDVKGVKKVLGAAAMTYVAAMLVALANLLRFIIRSKRR